MRFTFVSVAVVAAEIQQPSFEQWLAEQQESTIYLDGLSTNREENYNENVQIIDALNARDRTATYAVNQFSGMLFDEFRAKYLTLKTKPNISSVPGSEAESIPSVRADGVDWDVTPVKNQGNCGSCWTFGVMGAIEGMNKIKSGSAVILSEQELVDCDHSDNGCNGGLADSAYNFLEGKDLWTLESYPYTSGSSGHANSCGKGTPSGITVSRYITVGGVGSGRAGDAALSAVLMNGPVSISVAVDDQFSNYHSGVMSGVSTQCSINHAILATGFGPGFWKIKNSWGTRWGDAGFAKFERATAGCGPFGLFFQDSGFQPVLGGSPGPSPGPAPGPSPPAPSPPGPSPCNSCKYNDDCSNGEKCYYHSRSARHGCCFSSPPNIEWGSIDSGAQVIV